MPLSLIASQSVSGRCQQYIQPVSSWHQFYFGAEFPWQYAMGQLQQESNCKFVVSKDDFGSVGPAQITPSVWKKSMPKVDFWSVDGNAMAQAKINKLSYNQSYEKKLWVMFQIYNGGGLVNKEINRAKIHLHKNIVTQSEVRPFCRRSKGHYKNGLPFDNCKINYDYPINIYRYGNKYTNESQSSFIFW